MVNNKDKNTEAIILQAAREVFHERGMAGARMQQIADKAKINKALLHYYFRNKEQLFKAVFMEAFGILAPQMNKIFDADLPLFEKIQTFTEQYISFVMKNPFLPAFIMQEMNNNPEFTKEFLSNGHKPQPKKLLQQIQQEVVAGNIRPIDPMQLVVNIISLCVFPFVAGEMMKGIMGITQGKYEQFLEQRKKEVSQFIINSIKL